MSKAFVVVALAMVLFNGCATAAIPYQQPVGLLWGYTEDSPVRSDIGRTVAASKTKEQCELSLDNARKQPNAANARYSECRQLAFGSGDAYWAFTFPPHILIATAVATVNRQTCERSRDVIAKSGVALSPCTLTSLEFK